MGSYSTLWIDHLRLDSIVKNHPQPDFLSLFHYKDLREKRLTDKDLPPQLKSDYAELINEQEADDYHLIYYESHINHIKHRIELMGYSLANAEQGFDRWLKTRPDKKALQDLDVGKWLAAIEHIYKDQLKKSNEKHNNPLINLLLRQDWWDTPCADSLISFRLLLEILPNDSIWVYDVTDLVLSGWFDPIQEEFDQQQSLENSGKTIILTEGRFDTRVLSTALQLLYPHLTDFYSFMDFKGARVPGGAGSLVNLVKAFSGAGISNKIIAVFDNDAAAYEAVASLDNAKIAPNIKTRMLPHLGLLEKYPTIGPSGMTDMDVNGLAGSIELYLGSTALADENGSLHPVQWTGYKKKVKKYQGELIEKDTVQRNFDEQINRIMNDPETIDQYDWSGLVKVLELLFTTFHDYDLEYNILSFVDEYCS